MSHKQHSRFAFSGDFHPQVFDIVGYGLGFVQSVVVVKSAGIVQVFLVPIMLLYRKPHVGKCLFEVQAHPFMRFRIEHGVRLLCNYRKVFHCLCRAEPVVVLFHRRGDQRAAAEHEEHCQHRTSYNKRNMFFTIRFLPLCKNASYSIPLFCVFVHYFAPSARQKNSFAAKMQAKPSAQARTANFRLRKLSDG